MKEGREKEESKQDWTCTQGLGELELGSDGYIRATVWDRGVAFEAVGRVQQLTCDSVNGVRSTKPILTTVLHTLERDRSPLECMVAESRSLWVGVQSHGKVYC